MSASVSQIIIPTTRSVHPTAGCQNGRRKVRTHFPDNVLLHLTDNPRVLPHSTPNMHFLQFSLMVLVDSKTDGFQDEISLDTKK